MDFVYGTSASERDRGNLPALPVLNMFAEQYPTENKTVLQSRPGLELGGISMGTSPVRRLFQMEGILSDQVFGVAGTSLYGNATNLGSIDGTGPASFGGYEDRIFVNAGASIWEYDGSLAAVAFPDDTDVTSICVGASRLIAIQKDTGIIFWSDPLGDTIDPLNFATAENSPDLLKELLFIGDNLILFGTETVEFWSLSTDGVVPFAPVIGRVFPVGIRGTGCATTFNSTFAWITNDNQVCVGNPNQIVSTLGIQSLLDASTTASLWTFRLDGDEFLAVRMDDSTWVVNARTQSWSQMASFGETNWLPQCYEDGYFGSSANGALLSWSDTYADIDVILERRFRAWLPITDAGVPSYNITLRANPGQTTYVSGPYADPSVELRLSKDGGSAWGYWRPRALGAMGKYRQQTHWLSNGMFGYPGVLAEVRVTDPIPFRVSEMTMNGPHGGN